MDSQAVQREREITWERQEQERIEAAAAESVRQAEGRLVATLDSLRAAPTEELIDELEAGIEEERAANREVVRSLRVQLTAADSVTAFEQSRNAATQGVITDQAQAIENYEARLQVEIQRTEGSWTDPIVRALKYAGVFTVGYLTPRGYPLKSTDPKI